MKNYKKSDYAVNKYAKGIVYQFDGMVIEITLEDYLAENPGKTEQDFEELKAWSDADYLEQVQKDSRQCCKNISVNDIENAFVSTGLSPESIIFDEAETAERQARRIKAGSAALEKLTEIQRRRYLLHTTKALTTRKIADVEGVIHTKIQKSIEGATKKIKKNLNAE